MPLWILDQFSNSNKSSGYKILGLPLALNEPKLTDKHILTKHAWPILALHLKISVLRMWGSTRKGAFL